MVEPLVVMATVLAAVGSYYGSIAIARDVLRAFSPKLFPLPSRKLFLEADEDDFFRELEAKIAAPPVSIARALGGWEWKLLEKGPPRYELSLSFPDFKPGSPLIVNVQWTVLGGTSQFVLMEFSTSRTPPPRAAELATYQIHSMTKSIVASLNRQWKTRKNSSHSFWRSGPPPWSNQDNSATPVEPDLLPNRDSKQLRWPSAQEYNECLQNPGTSFTDIDLDNGVPELNQFGLPKAVTGNFASVYRVRCHAVDFAVRCFLRPIKDLEQRYEKLSEYICSDDLSYTVDMEFLSDGLRVGESTFPILKMEWVDGATFESYIESKILNGKSLDLLQTKFREMCQALYDAGIAHGDLQHGNIIVRNDELVLVDYDGMFVPSLSHLVHSHEIGHPNYQHPQRTSDHFGPYLDNFSAFVIDTSLMALCLSPNLWFELQAGDDCLLFRKRDFQNPAMSRVFLSLLSLADPALTNRIQQLKSFLTSDVREIPALGRDGEPILAFQNGD